MVNHSSRCKVIIYFLIFYAIVPRFDGIGAEDSNVDLSYLERLAETDLSNVDLAHTVLSICALVDPDIDINSCLYKIEQIVEHIEVALKKGIISSDEPHDLIKWISNYLFDDLGFPDRSVDMEVSKQFFSEYGLSPIHPINGNCCPLSIIYALLGERLDLPFLQVSGESHSLVCYKNGEDKIYIETTHRGSIIGENIDLKAFFCNVYPQDDFCIHDKKSAIVNAIIQCGAILCAQGKHDFGIELFHKTLPFNCSDQRFASYYSIGMWYNQINECDKALIFLCKAREENPNKLITLLEIGNAYHRMSKMKEAVIYYNRCIKADRKFNMAYQNLAVVLFELEDYEGALNALQLSKKYGTNYDETFYKNRVMELEEKIQESDKTDSIH